MASSVRIYVQSSLIPEPTYVEPVIKGLFEYKKETGRVYFKHESKDQFTFTKAADYALIKPQFAVECDEVEIVIERKRCGEWEEYWRGFFKMFNAREDRDKCTITVKVKPYDAYKCFEEKLEESQNIYTSGAVVSVSSVGGTIETETCTDINSSGNCGDYYAAYYTPLADCIDPDEWCLKENIITVNGIENPGECSGEDLVIEQETTWHREIVVGAEPTFGTGWEVLSVDGEEVTWWRCPGGGLILGPYTRGRTFENVMNRILENMGCDLTIKSDFFGINPEGDSPDNAAYDFAYSYCQNITVHQKSDIKFPGVLTPSSSPSWSIVPKEWFEDLRRMFNVRWIIVNGVLIIEHVSAFTSTMGLNLTGKKMPKALDYGTAESVKYENYYWPEDPSYDFRAASIIYDCGEKTKEERCTILHTDIAHIENAANAEKVSDTGFVLISNGLHGSDYIINDNNAPFKWSSLQDNLFKYDRLYKSGKINGVSQEFITWQRYIKQDKFKTPLCCGDEFDPLDLITTDLGIASNGTVTENIFTNQLELELMY